MIKSFIFYILEESIDKNYYAMFLPKPWGRITFLALCALVFSSNLPAQAQFRVLLFTETAGWHHESIQNGVTALKELAITHQFEVVRQQQARKITQESLVGFDAVIFLNTTEDIFDEEEQAVFEKFIQSGKGYVGVHGASDTEYDWEWYTQLVGRMFYIHPVIQTAKLKIIDHNFPGLEHFPNTLLWTDEYYEFGEEKVEGLNYLITLDENSFDPNVTWPNKDIDENGNLIPRVGKGMGEFHPLAWYHEFDGGRAFFTALGHVAKVYENQWFLDHLYGGIYYAATGRGIEKGK